MKPSAFLEELESFRRLYANRQRNPHLKGSNQREYTFIFQYHVGKFENKTIQERVMNFWNL